MRDDGGHGRQDRFHIRCAPTRDEADYGTEVRAAALQLAAERYLLEDDVERVVEAALARYRAAVSQ
jgi:hypothetical protein